MFVPRRTIAKYPAGTEVTMPFVGTPQVQYVGVLQLSSFVGKYTVHH